MLQVPWQKFSIRIQSEGVKAIPNHYEPIRKSFCILFDEKRSKTNKFIPLQSE